MAAAALAHGGLGGGGNLEFGAALEANDVPDVDPRFVEPWLDP